MPLGRNARSRVPHNAPVVNDTALADVLGSLVVVRPTGQILSWPFSAQHLFGYGPNEAMGRSFVELVVALDERPDMAHLLRTMAPNGTRVAASKRVHKNGRQILVQVAMRSDRGDAGDVILINDRETPPGDATAYATALHPRFRTVFESIPEAILLVDERGAIIEINDQACRLFDYTRDALLGSTVETLVPDRDRRIHANHRAAFARDPRQRPMGIGLELEGRRRDGTVFPVEINLSPLEAAGSQLVLTTIRDLTARKKTEAKFRSLLEAAPDAMIIVDRTGRIALVNSQAERLFGYARRDLVDSTIDMLVPERFRDGHRAHRVGYFGDPHVRPMGSGLELWGRRKDGSEFPVEISLGPVETEEGTLVTAAVRDVTERKRLEAARRRAEELEVRTAQEASRLKSEFLANMSHELRTPLNAVIGFAEMMHDGKAGSVSAMQVEFLEDILTSSRHLLQLINDVLDLSKVEAGKIDVRPERVDLPALILEVNGILRSMAAQKQIDVTVDVDPVVHTVIADPGKLKQVLYNFLSNALKFTPDRGRVHVRALALEPSEFELQVEDTGVGISAEDMTRLFVEFQQLDASLAKKYPGTGLGLALTRRLVEAQGGRVGARSQPARGSTFFAILPRAPLGKAPGMPESGDARPVVLVVDDDASALTLASHALAEHGYAPRLCSNAEEALRVATTEHPAALVVDLVMPAMDGVAFLERFRAQSGVGTVPAIVWTQGDFTSADLIRLRAVAHAVVWKDQGTAALVDELRRFRPPNAKVAAGEKATEPDDA